jgi:cold shock protein
MEKGKVKWLDPTKGYGFIGPENGIEDIFVHISELESAGYTSLSNYQAIHTKNGKSYAIKLQLI